VCTRSSPLLRNQERLEMRYHPEAQPRLPGRPFQMLITTRCIPKYSVTSYVFRYPPSSSINIHVLSANSIKLRRLNLNKDGGSASLAPDVILDARPGSASLSSFNSKAFSIVQEHIANEIGFSGSTSQSESELREPPPERGGPDHIRQLLRGSLPPLDVARHLLQKFLDHQNSIFYICSKEEAEEQLTLIYNSASFVSISWLCQMYLIFAIGVQFDDVYDTDGATYYDLGQKYIDDAVDENPQSTAWVIRAMLLLCFYQPPTKWKSVWMQLGNGTAFPQNCSGR
jgi:hypothetical protein